ncbi:hypothetical protein ACFC7B_04035 [Enterococcus gallinarum]|uniref:hypothetical protein n=1 Tax=Enterococcus gallinarum TaxID=1353 RepID=UPI0035E0A313
MTKSIFHIKTKEDYLEAARQLGELTGDSLGKSNHETYGEETCIFATQTTLLYGSYSHAVSFYGKTPQLFKVGMKIVKAPSDSEEYFIAVAQDKEAALQKLEELEAKVAELKAELTKSVEPLYKVVLPNPNAGEGSHLIVLGKYENEDNLGKVYIGKVKPTTLEYADFNNRYILTEEEIKTDFEWAWQFAERVQ